MHAAPEALLEIGMEVNLLCKAISEELDMLPPVQDPEDLAYREELRVDLGVYRHMDWLYRNELR